MVEHVCNATLGELKCKRTDPHEPHRGCVYVARGASHLLHEREETVHGGDDW